MNAETETKVYGHALRSSGVAKTILEGTVKGKRRGDTISKSGHK